VATVARPQVTLLSWVEQVVTGGGGFQAFEAHEMPLFAYERDIELASFVIKCLANPRCEGSAKVLAAIERQRREQS
jgi:hypothetical protein